MNDKTKLKNVIAVLDRYEKEIAEAVENDCEVTLGGNGVNCCEARHTFRPLAEELRKILTS